MSYLTLLLSGPVLTWRENFINFWLKMAKKNSQRSIRQHDGTTKTMLRNKFLFFINHVQRTNVFYHIQPLSVPNTRKVEKKIKQKILHIM